MTSTWIVHCCTVCLRFDKLEMEWSVHSIRFTFEQGVPFGVNSYFNYKINSQECVRKSNKENVFIHQFQKGIHQINWNFALFTKFPANFLH